MVRSATIVFGDGSMMAGDEYFDPEMDPELAMALNYPLRMSKPVKQPLHLIKAPKPTMINNNRLQMARHSSSSNRNKKCHSCKCIVYGLVFRVNVYYPSEGCC